MSLDEIKNNLGTPIFNEELSKYVGAKLKEDVSNIKALDLINYLVSNEDMLIDYANKYLMYGTFKEEFRKHLESEYKYILRD